jgi:hypothetical protein
MKKYARQRIGRTSRFLFHGRRGALTIVPDRTGPHIATTDVALNNVYRTFEVKDPPHQARGQRRVV